MRKIILAISAIAFFFASCTPTMIEEEKEKTFKVEIASVSVSEVTVNVTADEMTSYFINIYKASSFSSVTPEAIVRVLKRGLSEGESIAKSLNFGSETFVFDNLQYGTEYKVLAFCVQGDGQITSDPIVLDANTVKFEAELTATQVDCFGFELKVDPNIDDIGWFKVAFPYYEDLLVGKELFYKVLGALADATDQGNTYADIAFHGSNTSYVVCNPGDEVLVAVVAIDEKCQTISDVYTMHQKTPSEGYPVLAEDSSDYTHTCLYKTEQIGIGTMIEVTNPIAEGFVIALVEINGTTCDAYGIDFYSASKDEIGAFLARYAKEFYDSMVSDPSYAEYFAYLTPFQRISNFYQTAHQFAVENGKEWTSVTAEDLEDITNGKPLIKALNAMCLISIDDDENITYIPGSVAVAKHIF